MKALGLLCEYRQKAKHCVSSLKQRYFFTSPMYEKKIKDKNKENVTRGAFVGVSG